MTTQVPASTKREFNRRSIALFCMLNTRNAERLSKAYPGWLVGSRERGALGRSEDPLLYFVCSTPEMQRDSIALICMLNTRNAERLHCSNLHAQYPKCRETFEGISKLAGPESQWTETLRIWRTWGTGSKFDESTSHSSPLPLSLSYAHIGRTFIFIIIIIIFCLRKEIAMTYHMTTLISTSHMEEIPSLN